MVGSLGAPAGEGSLARGNSWATGIALCGRGQSVLRAGLLMSSWQHHPEHLCPSHFALPLQLHNHAAEPGA